MPQNKQEVHSYQENEITLRALFISLVERWFLIAGLTGFVTVLAILHALTITPTYLVTSSVLLPSENSIATMNAMGLATETKTSILAKYLNQISSKDLQLKVFIDGNYLTALNSENEQIDNINAYGLSFLSSFIIEEPVRTDAVLERPYLISMKGGNAEIISRYLDELTASANIQTIDDITSSMKSKTSIRLEEILLERGLLIEQAEKNRFSKIERIKEEDSQKIREIYGQIARARYKAKEDRLNQIVVLTDAAKLAGFLGIIENNLEKIDKVDKNNFNFNIAINEDADLPEWYLYGEKALIQRVELLKNRTSDDPFIPELVKLNNQLNEVQNNTLLKTLEKRQDDSPFVAEIIELDIEKINLESRIVSLSGVNTFQIREDANSKVVNSNKIMIVLLAFIVSFMMSIFLALIMGALKPNEKTLPK